MGTVEARIKICQPNMDFLTWYNANLKYQKQIGNVETEKKKEKKQPPKPVCVFTPSQLRVIKYRLRGKNNVEIARYLGVELITVTNYLNQIKWRMEAQSPADAIEKAVKMGLVTT